MGDDAINVHGFYLRIKKAEGRKIWFALEQCCQDGVNYYPDAGQMIEFISARSLQPYGEARIQSVEFDDETRSGVLCCEREIEEIAREGELIANQTEIARLTFERCVVRNIRGRAALVQTRGVLIDHCLFEGCTGGVHICTETGWWESIATRDITISNNRFLHCGYGKTSYCDAVAVVSSTNAPEQTVGLHKNIKILCNQIVGSVTPVLITCAEDVLLKGNTIACPQGIEVRTSRNVLIEDNLYSDG